MSYIWYSYKVFYKCPLLFFSLLRKFYWWLDHKDDVPANACLPCQKITKEENAAISEEKPSKTNQQNQENAQDTTIKSTEEKPKTTQNNENVQEQKDKNNEIGKDDKNGLPNEEKPDIEQNKAEQIQGACAAECIKKDNFKLPEFPLFPLSKGFQKSLENCLEQLKNAMVENGLGECLSNNK